jgi:hypothetical protein
MAAVDMILRAALPWLVLAIVVSSCAAPGTGPPFDLTTAVVSDETTGQIFVSAPDADGPWPVVVMLHGTGGNPHELDRADSPDADRTRGGIGSWHRNPAWPDCVHGPRAALHERRRHRSSAPCLDRCTALEACAITAVVRP